MSSLTIKAYTQFIADYPDNLLFANVYFQAVDLDGQPYVFTYVQIGATEDNTASPPVYTSATQAVDDLFDAQRDALLAIVNNNAAGPYFDSATLEFVDTPIAVALGMLAPVATSGAYSDLTGKPTLATVANTGAYSDLTGKPSLATVATSGSYNDLSSKPTIPAAQVQTDWNATTGLGALLNKPSLATVATSGSYTDLSNKPTIPTIPTLSFNNTASHSIVTGTGSTGFQVSSSRNALVNYSITISTSSTIASGAVGVVVLEIAPTNSTTAGDWVEVGRISQGQTLGLALALSITQPIAGQVGGIIPAGYYAKLRSINTTGTPTYAYNSGQEVLM